MKFTIELKTADVSGAGTDANVYIILKGTAGQTSKLDLDNNGEDNFEQGDTDRFIRHWDAPLGTIWGVELGHDDEGGGSGWRPESIKVYGKWTNPSGSGGSVSSANNPWVTDNPWANFVEPDKLLFSTGIDGWLSSDNDGYLGAGKQSLRRSFGQPPKETSPKIRPPKGDWKDYPTGVVAGVRIYNSSGANITTGVSKTVEARISRTAGNTTTTGQETTESVDIKISANALGLAETETTFGFSATQRKDVETQLVEMVEAAEARTQEMSFSQQISLEKDQVAVVVFEIYEVRRSEPGQIELGNQTYVFSDFITYQVPNIEYFRDGSDDLKRRLRALANADDTKQLVSEHALARYAPET